MADGQTEEPQGIQISLDPEEVEIQGITFKFQPAGTSALGDLANQAPEYAKLMRGFRLEQTKRLVKDGELEVDEPDERLKQIEAELANIEDDLGGKEVHLGRDQLDPLYDWLIERLEDVHPITTNGGREIDWAEQGEETQKQVLDHLDFAIVAELQTEIQNA